MKIAICGSLDFILEMKNTHDRLVVQGHTVLMPKSAEMVIKGGILEQEIKDENLDSTKRIERKIKLDAIKRHYNKIAESDAILVLNYTKKNIENYIGGNTFLEMGFAHVLDKKIFLLNPVPKMSYTDEILAMMPEVIGTDLSKIA